MQSYALALFAMLLVPVTAAPPLRHHPRWQRILLSFPVMGALAKGQKLGRSSPCCRSRSRRALHSYRGLKVQKRLLKAGTGREYSAAYARTLKRSPRLVVLSEGGNVYPLCIQLLRTGEMSGSLDVMLANLARHHTEQTFQRADNLAALLEPLLPGCYGVIIGTLVVAMYLPIFHLGDAMSAGSSAGAQACASESHYRLLKTRFSCS